MTNVNLIDATQPLLFFLHSQEQSGTIFLAVPLGRSPRRSGAARAPRPGLNHLTSCRKKPLLQLAPTVVSLGRGTRFWSIQSNLNQFVGSSFGSGLKYVSNQPLSRPTPSPRPASPTEPSELRGRAKAAVGARSCGNAAPRGRTRPFLCGSRPAKRRHISNAIGSLASFALNMLGNMNMFQWLNCLGRGGLAVKHGYVSSWGTARIAAFSCYFPLNQP